MPLFPFPLRSCALTSAYEWFRLPRLRVRPPSLCTLSLTPPRSYLHLQGVRNRLTLLHERAAIAIEISSNFLGNYETEEKAEFLSSFGNFEKETN